MEYSARQVQYSTRMVYTYPTQPKEAQQYFESILKVGAALTIAGFVGLLVLRFLS